MTEVWVVNASPVILLAKAGLLELLSELPDALLLPEAVATEILAGPVDDPARQAVSAGWGTRRKATAMPDTILEWGLGPGESSVIALAAETDGGIAILDDRLGRAAALAHHLPVIGSLGVILRAKRAGRLTRVTEAIERLQQAGLYLQPDILAAVLELADERD